MLKDCTKFNLPVTIVESNTKFNANYMFSGCTLFNQPIDFKNRASAATYLFQKCTKFNQPFTIPSSITNSLRSKANSVSDKEISTIKQSKNGNTFAKRISPILDL